MTETYECDGCTCCSSQGCTRDERSECPTDSLGDSICPCTEAF
jgi:hypothetical protein